MTDPIASIDKMVDMVARALRERVTAPNYRDEQAETCIKEVFEEALSAERERCAALCERADRHGSLRQVAAEIRKGDVPLEWMTRDQGEK